MFLSLLTELGLSEEDLTPYQGSNLSGFNGLKTKHLDYIELMVTYDNKPLTRTVKTHFPIFPFLSVYNCIIGRLTLGRLGVVASTFQVKMKFYSLKDEIIMLNADLDSRQRCHFLSPKFDQEEPTLETAKKKKHGKEADVNLADLDAYSGDEKNDPLALELEERIGRFHSVGKYLFTPIGESHKKIIQINPGCFHEHVDFFARGTTNCRGTPLDISFCHVAIDQPKKKAEVS